MKKANVIYRWFVVMVLLCFALQETNGGRFPSVYDQFWRSWSVVAGRPLWDIVFGLVIFLTAIGVLLKMGSARWAAIVLLVFEGTKALIGTVITSDFHHASREIGDAGAALFCVMLLAKLYFRPATSASVEQQL